MPCRKNPEQKSTFKRAFFRFSEGTLWLTADSVELQEEMRIACITEGCGGKDIFLSDLHATQRAHPVGTLFFCCDDLSAVPMLPAAACAFIKLGIPLQDLKTFAETLIVNDLAVTQKAQRLNDLRIDHYKKSLFY